MEESWLRAFKARELIDRSHAVLENNQRDADVVLQMKRARRDRLWRYIKSKDKPPPRFQPSHNSKKDVQATVYQVEKVKAQRDLIRTSVSQSYITSCREDESLFFSESRANQVASMSHQRKLSHTRKKKTFWRSDMFDLKDAMAHHKQEFVRLLDHFTPDHLRALHRIFLRADLRSIGEEQFLQHVQTLVSPLTSQREGLKNIFREIDTDNDGQIRWADVAEFFANSLSGEHENSG